MEVLERLTNIIADYETKPWGSTDDLHAAIWPDLDFIRNNNNKEALLEGWRYKGDLDSAENDHMNGEKMFRLLGWEQSFVLSIIYGLYH